MQWLCGGARRLVRRLDRPNDPRSIEFADRTPTLLELLSRCQLPLTVQLTLLGAKRFLTLQSDILMCNLY